MTHVKNIQISQYSYDLPEDRIAKYPLKERGNSKLLLYRPEEDIKHTTFTELNHYLPNNSLLVFNNTKVVHARFHFYKHTGAKIEIFCLEPILPADYQTVFNTRKSCRWKCLVGNMRKWKNDILTQDLEIDGKTITLSVSKSGTYSDAVIIDFFWDNEQITFGEIMANAGTIPIPPYLQRESESVDSLRYQTVYSKQEGSVAAPTAGLHFTQSLLRELTQNGHKTAEITLHIGAGTFKPVNNQFIGNHEMHTEYFEFNKDFIQTLIQHKGSIIATGTTTLRTIESIYQIGLKILENKTVGLNKLYISQWECYEKKDKPCMTESLEAVLSYMQMNDIDVINSYTQIIIVPGYEFKMADYLITNFHMPKSTLLLLIAAFAGQNWRTIYKYALDNNFRFLSYGDSSLLKRNQ